MCGISVIINIGGNKQGEPFLSSHAQILWVPRYKHPYFQERSGCSSSWLKRGLPRPNILMTNKCLFCVSASVCSLRATMKGKACAHFINRATINIKQDEDRKEYAPLILALSQEDQTRVNEAVGEEMQHLGAKVGEIISSYYPCDLPVILAMLRGYTAYQISQLPPTGQHISKDIEEGLAFISFGIQQTK